MEPFIQSLLDNVVFLMFLLPVVGAGLVVLSSKLDVHSIRRTAITNALLTLSLAVLMVANYDPGKASQPGKPQLVQMATALRWLSHQQPPPLLRKSLETSNKTTDKTAKPAIIVGPNIRVAVGVDGVSLWLVTLTAVMLVPVLLAGRESDHRNPTAYYALLLLLQSALIGTFAALDVVLFFACFEWTSLLLLFLIGHWGGHDRRAIIQKYFTVNLLGSLLVGLGLIALVISHQWISSTESNPHPSPVFDIAHLLKAIPALSSTDLPSMQYWRRVSPWIFLAFLLGFAVRVPLLPLHARFVGVRSTSPTDLNLLLIGVVLKTGCYGAIRFLLPLFPELCSSVAGLLTGVAVFGIVYTGLLTVKQRNFQTVITYACLGPFFLGVVGILSLNVMGLSGGLLLLFTHGVSVCAVWLLAGMIAKRFPITEVASLTGLFRSCPQLTAAMIVALLSLIAIPGLGGFPGELLILVGVFESSPYFTLWCSAGLLLIGWSIFSMFPLMFRAQHQSRSGEFPPAQSSHVGNDLSRRELLALAPLFVLIVWTGLFPRFFLDRMRPSIASTLENYRSTVEVSSAKPRHHSRVTYENSCWVLARGGRVSKAQSRSSWPRKSVIRFGPSSQKTDMPQTSSD